MEPIMVSMAEDEPEFETPPDLPAALAALVLALEERGALSRDRYRDILEGLWTAMPEDAAFDREAQTCARLLEFLDGAPLTRNSAIP